MKKNMMFIFAFLLCFNLFSCRKIEEANVEPVEVDILSFIINSSPYVKDGSLDFFITHPWYAYDDVNHIIWPVFQVYSLKTKGGYYKFQVADYYSGTINPATYTLRFEKENEEPVEFILNGTACGNIFTNPDFEACEADPERNTYTYLNIDEQRQWKMKDEEARNREDWDIGFNGTKIRLNAGIDGPGSTRIAPLYLFGGFFRGENPNLETISQVSFSDKGQRYFDLSYELKTATFALPNGIDRVIHESDWIIRSESTFTANTNNWWILKNNTGNSYAKLRVKDITDTPVESGTESEITFEYFYQESTSPIFETESKTITLPKFVSGRRVTRFCVDFDGESVVDCNEDSWDIRLQARERRGVRDWRINAREGAIGPIQDPQNWVSAPIN